MALLLLLLVELEGESPTLRYDACMRIFYMEGVLACRVEGACEDRRACELSWEDRG